MEWGRAEEKTQIKRTDPKCQDLQCAKLKAFEEISAK